MSEQTNMAARYEHEIPEGYKARIEGNKVIIEQKKSEDERIRMALINLISYDKAAGYIGFYKEAGFTCDDAITYLEKQKEQKPAEWSDEDKRLLRTTLECLNYVSCQSKTSVVNWLKSLPERFNIQPKQEWSEEDKRAIDRACVALRAYSNGELPEFLPSELLGYADRLQSLLLQPHWKPSDK